MYSTYLKSAEYEYPLPLPRMTYQEAMERYGSDKPDTRFGMELQNISALVSDLDFVVFRSALETGGSVRAIVAKQAAKTLTRKEIDKLTEKAKGIGAKGLAFIRWMMRNQPAPLRNSCQKADWKRFSHTWAVNRATLF